KLHIAQKYLLKKEMEAHGLTKDNIELPEQVIRTIIRKYTKEAGVRNLEREIATICRKTAKEIALKGKDKKIRITQGGLEKSLGVPKFRFGLAEEKDEVGMVTGLAWTEFGGELLSTEVTIMPGKGKLIITGKLGDVMQESAQAAMSYVRSRAMLFGLDKDFY